jgi:hypothetical protein
VTRRIALLISSALTVFVLSVGGGVAWYLQAGASDTSAANAADLAARGAIRPPTADRAAQDVRQFDDGGQARGDQLASSPRPLPPQTGSATASDGHDIGVERERHSRLQSGRAVGDQAGSIMRARGERYGSQGDRDD